MFYVYTYMSEYRLMHTCTNIDEYMHIIHTYTPTQHINKYVQPVPKAQTRISLLFFGGRGRRGHLLIDDSRQAKRYAKSCTSILQPSNSIKSIQCQSSSNNAFCISKYSINGLACLFAYIGVAVSWLF